MVADARQERVESVGYNLAWAAALSLWSQEWSLKDLDRISSVAMSV